MSWLKQRDMSLDPVGAPECPKTDCKCPYKSTKYRPETCMIKGGPKRCDFADAMSANVNKITETTKNAATQLAKRTYGAAKKTRSPK